jgi:hypothetical protein
MDKIVPAVYGHAAVENPLKAFWGTQCILLESLAHEARMNAYCYCTTLEHLKEANWMKCPILLRVKVTFLHDSSHSTTPHVTVQLVEQLQSCLGPSLLWTNEKKFQMRFNMIMV